MADMEHEETVRTYNFKVVWGNEVVAHVTEVAGIVLDVEEIRHRQDGVDQPARVLPGRPVYGDVVLKHGVSTSSRFVAWFMAAASGEVERRDVSLVLLDADGRTGRVRWNLYGAWPCSWSGARSSAGDEDLAFETITLVYESVERDTM